MGIVKVKRGIWRLDLWDRIPQIQPRGVGDGVQESGLKTQIRLDPFPPKLHIKVAFLPNFLHFALVVLISIGPFSSFQKNRKNSQKSAERSMF